ncbi:hypothetical protein Trydic_g10613 [Trypoxylus dichotomus]
MNHLIVNREAASSHFLLPAKLLLQLCSAASWMLPIRQDGTPRGGDKERSLIESQFSRIPPQSTDDIADAEGELYNIFLLIDSELDCRCGCTSTL